MLDKVQQYLQTELDSNKKYLLGLSGGPDSIFLFHMLLQLGISFSVLHVDHSMREESAREAKELEEMVKGYKIPFYLEKLPLIDSNRGNIEGVLREERYACFKKVYKEIGAFGLLLGHQKDDQIETIFKRILEGGGIGSLGGISFFSLREGMHIHRPLLFLQKKEILGWLEERKIAYFWDRMNEDEKYLRARLRKKILPQLERDFGKGISSNLYKLGENMQRVWEYVAKQVEDITKRIVEGDKGIYVEGPFSLQPIELEYILREMGKRKEIGFSQDEIERMIGLIAGKKYGKGLVRNGWHVCIEKKGVFFFSPKIGEKENRYVTKVEERVQNWKDFLHTERYIHVPSIECVLQKPILKERLPNGVTLAKWYSQHEVPVFFRSWFPVIYKNGKLQGECLSGRPVLNKEMMF